MTGNAIEPKRYAGTDEKLSRFLQRVAMHGMLNRAAREVGIAYSTVWRHRKLNPAFDESVLDAVEEALDRAEEVIWDLMTDPNTNDMVRLKAAMFVLRQRRPQVYGTKVTVIEKQQLVRYISNVPRPPDSSSLPHPAS